MKKIIFLFSFLTLITLNTVSSFAQETLPLNQATVSADSNTSKSVEYELPYPGILPDHPLYFLKMTRDWIVRLLISDLLKKAEFDLLQADKRLNSGLYLLHNDKDKNAELAQSTISKGEDYFEEAIKNAEKAKKQGMDTKDVLRRLLDSSKKHQEILQSLGSKSTEALKDDYFHLQERAEGFERAVSSLSAE